MSPQTITLCAAEQIATYLLQATTALPVNALLLSKARSCKTRLAQEVLHLNSSHSSSLLLSYPYLAVCELCSSTNPGKRRVVGPGTAQFYPCPCARSYPVGELAQCTVFDVTGVRSGSVCNDGQCYLQISLSGANYWIVDHACGVEASLFGTEDAACGKSRSPAC